MITGMATATAIKRRPPRILIAGLGNLLLRDDGVGVHAVRALARRPPRGVICAEVGTAVLDALHLLEWAEKIVAPDAMAVGGPPGTVYACGAADVEEPGVKASLHELSLLAALRFLKEKARPEIVILGVEPQTIDFGLDLSPPVAAALPRLLEAVKEQVARWREREAEA